MIAAVPRRRLVLGAGVLGLLLAASASVAGDTGPTSDSSAGGLSASSRAMIRTFAEANLLALQAARLARQKGQSADVKEFAAAMEAEHAEAADRLKHFAQQKGVQVRDSLESQDAAKLAKLQSLQGAEFDRAYSQEMVQTHQEAVKLFEAAASSAPETDVQAYAQSQLPMLRKHLRMAQSLPTAARS
jgi:putative membrane protein